MSDVSADFYVNLGDGAEWLGSVVTDGDAQTLQAEYELFGPPADAEYTEDSYRRIVAAVLADAIADELGYSAAKGDGWPWDYPDSSGTGMVYVFNNGTIHVFEQGTDEGGQPGQFLVAMHYPNAARRPRAFPNMAARRAGQDEGEG